MSEYKLTEKDKEIAFELAEYALQSLWENLDLSSQIREHAWDVLAEEAQANDTDEGSAFHELYHSAIAGNVLSDRWDAIAEEVVDCFHLTIESPDEYRKRLAKEHADYDESTAAAAQHLGKILKLSLEEEQRKTIEA
jgi:hypothetical protein